MHPAASLASKSAIDTPPKVTFKHTDTYSEYSEDQPANEMTPMTPVSPQRAQKLSYEEYDANTRDNEAVLGEWDNVDSDDDSFVLTGHWDDDVNGTPKKTSRRRCNTRRGLKVHASWRLEDTGDASSEDEYWADTFEDDE